MKQNANELKGMSGHIKWFDALKGYGFIIGPEGEDIFVHYTEIIDEGFRTLKDGSMVMYDAIRGEKGWHARQVVPMKATIQSTQRMGDIPGAKAQEVPR